jgi:transposase
MVTPKRHQNVPILKMLSSKSISYFGATIMKCKRISIDLAKNIFQLCVVSDENTILFNKKVKRSNLIHELRQFEPTTVVMEACYSSNPWGRAIQKIGHTVLLIPAFVVKPFVVGNKNDANDALAIFEASMRPKTRFVKVKSVEQQDIQSLERARDLIIKNRTATMNQMRGLLAEYGVVAPKGARKLLEATSDALEDPDNELTIITRRLIRRLNDIIKGLYEQALEIENELRSNLKDNEEYERLLTIPGVGPAIASSILGAVSDANMFKNGRQFAAWLGLTPSQHASGDRNSMGRITKRGNKYLRLLLVHGARAVLRWSSNKTDKLSQWLNNLTARMHKCRAAVSYANKMARIIWSVLSKKQAFDYNLACA